MAEVESILSSSLCDTPYHLALPQEQKRNIYEALWLRCILHYRSRSGSSVGDPGPLVLTLLAVDLSLPPLDLLSFMVPPFSFIFTTIGFPFLPFRSYFRFPSCIGV